MIKKTCILIFPLMAFTHSACAENWKEVSDLLMSKTYVDMDSMSQEQGYSNRYRVSYKNKIISKSDNSGLAKGNYVISDVIDNCDTHEQEVYSIKIYSMEGRNLQANYGGNEPLDILGLKPNMAQYAAHYKICQELKKRPAIDSKEDSVATATAEPIVEPKQVRNLAVENNSNEIFANQIVQETTNHNELDRSMQKMSVTRNTNMFKNTPKHEWEFLAQSSTLRVELDKQSILKNKSTNRVLYSIRYTVIGQGKSNSFKNGESIVLNVISDCNNSSTMKLSALKYKDDGSLDYQKQYIDKKAEFEKHSENNLSYIALESACSTSI